MTERMRLYIGSSELDYSEAYFQKTRGTLVNRGEAKISSNAAAVDAAIIDFKKVDGSTNVFSTRLQNRKREQMWTLELYSLGWELNNIPITKVYRDTAPEDIVQDVIDNYSQHLTFSSSASSGVTLDVYVAKGYLIDVITDMMNVLKWDFVINDANGNVTFTPPGTNNNNVVLTNGNNFQVTFFEDDPKRVINHIKVIGGFENLQTTETIAGTGTSFTLSHKPQGTFKAEVFGTEVDPTEYVVSSEERLVTFTSSQTDPVFTYSYARPIIVEQQDDDSIATYGEVYKEFPAPWLNTLAVARQYAKKLLALKKVPPVICRGIKPGLDFTLSEGELVTVIDPLRGEARQLVIDIITFRAETSQTELSLGTQQFLIGDWQKEVQQRIKDLERRGLNQEDITMARTVTANLQVELTISDSSFQYSYPNNSFVLGHETLGYLRPSVDYEPDCSPNNINNGTWQGSGLSGAQYITTGWRTGTSCGRFNGTNNYISLGNNSSLDLTGDFTLMCAIRVSSLPSAQRYIFQKLDATNGYGIRTTATNRVELIYRTGGVGTTLTLATSSPLVANIWMHVAFVKSGTNLTAYVNGSVDSTGTGSASVGTTTNNLEVGRSGSTYFTGDIDEIRIYSNDLSSSQIQDINNFIHHSTDLECYIAFDNCSLDGVESTRVDVT